MINKLLGLIALSTFLLTIASCTPAGLSVNLLGKWKSSKVTVDGQDLNSTMTVEIEFRNDDSFKRTTVVTTGLTSTANIDYGKVVKVDTIQKTIVIKNKKDESEMVYNYQLNLNKLRVEYKEGSSTIKTEMDKK